MAGVIRVEVDPEKLYLATNAPGVGDVWTYMNRMRIDVVDHLARNAPRNNRLNERHRPPDPRPYRLSFDSRMNSNQYGVTVTWTNSSPHADIVEFGRGGTNRPERFSSVKSGGVIKWHHRGTRGRPGTYYFNKTASRAIRRYG